MAKKRLKPKISLGLNETGVGGVVGAMSGLAIFEGLAHMGTAGLVFAGAAAIIGGLNGKLVADGGKFVAEKMLVSPPATLAQETFGKITSAQQNLDSIRQSSDNSKNTINLGTDKRTRRDVEYTMYALKGILILGLPGMGKTVTVSTIASQLVTNGARLSIIDIKGQLDDSLTGLLSSFEAAFATPPAHTPQLMLETAEYADNILEDRLSKRTTDLYPFYLIIDEFTDLMLSLKAKDRYTEAATKIAEVVKRINILGRSLNIFCFCVGQITTAETTGGTAIRETFNTRILHGMSEYEAGIVDKNGGKKAISQLGVGEAYVTVGGIKADPQTIKIRQISDEEKRRIASSIVPLKQRETGPLEANDELLSLTQKGIDYDERPKATRQLQEEMVEIGKDNGPGKNPIYTSKSNIDLLVAAARAGKPISQSNIQAMLGCSEHIAKNVSRIAGERAASLEELS